MAHAAPVTDDAGYTLNLARPAQRVISLAPSLTEMTYAAGAGEFLIGAVEYSDYPPPALKLPRIGSNQKLDLERILALKPDLILVWYHGNAQREIETLRSLGIPMAYFEPHNIKDIPGVLERLGQLLGTEAAARRSADAFRQRHAALRKDFAGRSPVRVFYQVTSKPLLTINDKQIISDVIQLCGGVNVFGKETTLVPRLSTESVVAANPDVIITSRLGSAAGAKQNPDDESLQMWNAFRSLKAVRTRQMWLISGDHISRHGPRILDAAEAMCAALDEARKIK